MKLRLVLLSAAAIAVASPALAEPFSGGYLGVEVGSDNYNIKTTDLLANTVGGFGDNIDGLSAHGAVGGVYAGYDFAMGDKWFAGLEVSASKSGADLSLTDKVDDFDDLSTIATVKVEAKETYGISARVGYMLNEKTALYGRLGVAKTKFKASLSATNVYDPETDDLVDVSGSESDSDTATTYGVGLETKVSEHLSLRAEYNVLDYGDVLGGDDADIKLDVKNSRFTFGGAYRF